MRRGVVITAILLVAGVAGYWLKSRSGIDLIESFSLQPYLPSFFRVSLPVIHGGPGALIEETFEDSHASNRWLRLWAKRKGTVTRGYESGGADGSRCLTITNAGPDHWAYTYRGWIEAAEGDAFRLEGMAKVMGNDEASAAIGIVLHDQEKRVLEWHYAQGRVKATARWERVEREFVVPSGVAYLTFRVTGRGAGQTKLDGLRLMKLPPMSG